MASLATGTCYLCKADVTEEDYRREVDCPGRCEGRVFHEDCIASYLKKTKYSRDRCTGFPCPVILPSGKACPGYCCKMHWYGPTNNKKKAARCEAAILAATAAAPKPPKPPKQPAPAKPAPAANKLAPAPVAKPTPVQLAKPAPKLQSAPAPAFVPGLDLDTLRATANKLKAEARGSGGKGGQKPTAAVGAAAGRQQQQAAVQQQVSAATYFDRIKNMSELSKNGGKAGGMFSKRLEVEFGMNGSKEGLGDDSLSWGGSECDSVHTRSSNRGSDSPNGGRSVEELSLDTDFPSLQSSLVPSPNAQDITPAAQLQQQQEKDAQQLLLLDTAPQQDADDPIVEHDMLYANDDGSYLVLDALTNQYFRVEDLYGPAPEYVELPAENGATFLCVYVRRSHLAAREARQRAWLEANVLEEPAPPAQVQAHTGAGAGVVLTASELLLGAGTAAGAGVAAAAAPAPMVPLPEVHKGAAASCGAARASDDSDEAEDLADYLGLCLGV